MAEQQAIEEARRIMLEKIREENARSAAMGVDENNAAGGSDNGPDD